MTSQEAQQLAHEVFERVGWVGAKPVRRSEGRIVGGWGDNPGGWAVQALHPENPKHIYTWFDLADFAEWETVWKAQGFPGQDVEYTKYPEEWRVGQRAFLLTDKFEPEGRGGEEVKLHHRLDDGGWVCRVNRNGKLLFATPQDLTVMF